MSYTNRFRALSRAGLTAVFAVLAASCGGTVNGGGSPQRIHPGGSCNPTGLRAKAEDGCNTCTCGDGTWSCTELACGVEDGGSPGTPCQVGASRGAGDGCNTCQCMAGGTWACTRSVCAVCQAGETRNDGCNACSCSGGQWACTDRACPPPPVCKEGDSKAAGDGCDTCSCSGGQWVCTRYPCVDSGPLVQCQAGDTKNDGCNTCSCAGGYWSCTLRYCPPPACQPGQTSYDGCNTCSCVGGQWACTACADSGVAVGCGGFLGNTCKPSEYCAYTEGQACGGADASAVCKPRPASCTLNIDPVCGCNGNTYDNVCSAAASGTGVLHHGPC